MSSVNNNNPKPLLRLGALWYQDIKITVRYTYVSCRSVETLLVLLDN